jgi:hypothetical protein
VQNLLLLRQAVIEPLHRIAADGADDLFASSRAAPPARLAPCGWPRLHAHENSRKNLT